MAIPHEHLEQLVGWKEWGRYFMLIGLDMAALQEAYLLRRLDLLN